LYSNTGDINLFLEIANSLLGTIKSLRGAMKSLRGAIKSLRGAIKSLRGAIKSPRGAIKSLRGAIKSLRGAIESPRGAITEVPRGDCHGCCFGTANSSHLNSNTTKTSSKENNDSYTSMKAFTKVQPVSNSQNLNNNSKHNSTILINQVSLHKSQVKLRPCVRMRRLSRLCAKLPNRRVRDREPSRIRMKKIIILLKNRKLRFKYKKMLTKGLPISSVLHNIATNYKQWTLKYIHKQDSFYSSYFMKTKISSLRHNVSQHKILLSGDNNILCWDL